MAYIERTDEEIIAAWERWLDSCPKPDEVVFLVMGRGSFTSREVVEAMKARDEYFMTLFVEGARKAGREYGHDPVEFIVSKLKNNESDEFREEGGES